MEKSQHTDLSPLFLQYLENALAHTNSRINSANHKSDLANFFQDVQQDAANDAATIQQGLHPATSIKELLAIYFESKLGNAEAPLETDLSWPLSSYFISSSHNTYLTGNQLYSKSSVDEYMSVLRRCGRCVEVDVWDGKQPEEKEKRGESSAGAQDSNDEKSNRSLRERLGRVHLRNSSHERGDSTVKPGDKSAVDQRPSEGSSYGARVEPRVLHGHTLTRDVSFRMVCEAIRRTAFVMSDLPIVVSLEVHCSLDQQTRMVEIMEQEWKEHLVAQPTSEKQSAISTLPALQDLKKKILVKVKYTPPEKAMKREEANAASSEEEEEDDESGQNDPAKSPKKKKMLEALSRLGVYTRAYHFKSFDQPEAKIPTHIFALSERRIMEAMQKSSEVLLEHNKSYFMRAYPKATRLTSSNYDPIPFWQQGIQMVALNWQSLDKSMMINEAMFSGSSGWVLKPAFLRNNSAKDREHSEGVNATPSVLQSMDVTIEIAAGQNLPLPSGTKDEKSFRPYLKIMVHLPDTEEGPNSSRESSPGRIPAPTSVRNRVKKVSSKDRKNDPKTNESGAIDSFKLKQRTATGRGKNPDFKQEKLLFRNLQMQDEALCFVRFKLFDDIELRRDSLAGWACVRLDRLRPGWRILGIRSVEDLGNTGSLLLKITKSPRVGE